jgi:hypothetical protein
MKILLQNDANVGQQPGEIPFHQDRPQPQDDSEDEDEQTESVVETIRIQQKYVECLKKTLLFDAPLLILLMRSHRNVAARDWLAEHPGGTKEEFAQYFDSLTQAQMKDWKKRAADLVCLCKYLGFRSPCLWDV